MARPSGQGNIDGESIRVIVQYPERKNQSTYCDPKIQQVPSPLLLIIVTNCLYLVKSFFCSVRGWVEGHVRAFDKHMNIVLTDVDEHYAVNKVKLPR